MLCTSGVIYGENGSVQHAYMVKKSARGPVDPLRWRRTRISDWRKDANLTQQQVADALTADGVRLDRVSIGRIEAGQQMATIAALECMASLFETDIDSMLKYTPEQARQIQAFWRLRPDEQATVLRIARATRGGGE